MKLMILEYVEELTDRYHSGGALVIIAKDIKRAKELISNDKNIKPTERDWNEAIIYELKNDEEERYFIFQDAGCC